MELFNQTGPGSYYNTTSIKGEELETAKEKAQSQAAEILQILANCPSVGFTCWDVLNRVDGRYPIGSIRRTLTNLCDDTFIRHIGKRKAGPYKADCFVYQFNVKNIPNP